MTLFDYSRFRVVIVTGPQRSGTTIAARIIAAESGMAYVDEDDYGTKDRAAWEALVGHGDGLVIQSPAMARWVHTAVSGMEDVAVVWMIRPLADIVYSQYRIGWNGADERIKYGVSGDDNRPIAIIKRAFWVSSQRQEIEHWFEIDYSDLAAHHLWVDVNARVNFGTRQWRLEEKRAG